MVASIESRTSQVQHQHLPAHAQVRLFSGRKKQPLAVLRYHQKEVTCVRFQPLQHVSDAWAAAGEAGLAFATASRDRTVALWSV